ncbi:hypothetical protein MYAM1_002960 [Malassezia yamatoensis]|uniref:DUF6533 domain-containing protein n=1 Tax=Malassezia yamatoensis TaxID=253288 RepID=A0AAJ6CJX2_9BASI|nr:hypothetical protein MYAM1_002960 [Malassezia yamatoensis]
MRRRGWFWLMLAWLLVGIVLCESVGANRTYNNSTVILEKDKSYDDPTTSRELNEEQQEQQTRVANYITVASLTLYAWEYMRTFPREITMYQRHMLRRPQVILFLLIRYGTIPALILPAWTLWNHFDESSDCPQKEQITVAVVQFLVACIFSWRTIAIWRRKRWVIVLLVCLTIVMFGVSVGLLFHSSDAVTYSGACRPSVDKDDGIKTPPAVNSVKWFYLTSLIFDTVTLVLSSYKLIYYANMGRHLQTPVFHDPFATYRMDATHTDSSKELPGPVVDNGNRRSSATNALKQIPNKMNCIATFPFRKVHNALQWWSSLTPLLARLIANGFLYFFVATAFNVVNFVLEQVNSIHSKSFLTLYSPLMCVLCQNMILTELDAVWSTYDADLDIPGRRFVDRVVGTHGEQRSRMSELDRFQEFVSELEKQHGSSDSSTLPRRGGFGAKDIDSPLQSQTDKADKSSQNSFQNPAQVRRSSVDPSDTKPVSPRHLHPTMAPRTQAQSPSNELDPRAVPSTAPASINIPVAQSSHTSTPSESLPRLSATQQQRALRMAGLL